MLVNEDLIAAVFAKRCLWDQRNKHYHNRHVVDENWNEIGRELNQDARCMKKKWKQLRDTFRSELKRFPLDCSGDPGPDGVTEIQSQWIHFKSMMFVKDQMKCRKSSDIQKFKSFEQNNSIDDDENNNNNIDIKDSNMSALETPISQNSRANRKRRHHDMNPEINNIEEKKLEIKKQKSQEPIQTDDEDMSFFVSLLSHVKRMDPEAKLLCRMEMQASVLNHAYRNPSNFIPNVQSQNVYSPSTMYTRQFDRKAKKSSSLSASTPRPQLL